MINLKTTENSIKLLTKGKYCDDDINVTFEGGSVTIKTKDTWQGTQVPNNSYVENVYLNTNLSVDEVVSLMSTLKYPLSVEGDNYIVLYDESNRYIMLVDLTSYGYGYVISVNMGEDVDFLNIFTSDLSTSEFIGLDFVGWNPNFDGMIPFNSNVLDTFLDTIVGESNSKIVSLISTTPFTYQEGKTIELSGEYDGSSVEVTEAGKVDIKALIDEKKIPLEINVTYEGGSGVVEVDELPTNPQENVIYQVNGVSDIDVLVWVGAPYSRANLEQFIRETGLTSNLKYYLVDSLPTNPQVSDFQTFNPAHIYICEDIAYAYGNIGYGDMWLEVVTLFNNLTQSNLENKGYVGSISGIAEAGLYVTYKLGEQGLYNKYNLLTKEGNYWNDYKKIFDKTIEEYSSDTIQEILYSSFYKCEKLRKVYAPNVTYIYPDAFYSCGNLESVYMPNLEIINSGSFCFCESLQNFDFSNVESIGNRAFRECIDLFVKTKSVANLPKVANIGDNAFLEVMIDSLILGVNKVCGLSAVSAFEHSGINAIYVPDNLVEEYKIATNWTYYASKIKPLSEYVEE